MPSQAPEARAEYLRRFGNDLAAEAKAWRDTVGDDEGLRRHLQWIQASRHETMSLEDGALQDIPPDDVTLQDARFLAAASHGLQPYLDRCARVLGESMTRAGVKIGDPYYVGVLPGPDFNAWTLETAEGALLLVSAQLTYVLYGASSVLVHMVDLGNLGGPLYTEDQVRAAWDRLLRAYGANRDAREMLWFAPQGGVRGRLQDVLSDIAHLFVVAHEMGHASLGHHRPDQSHPIGIEEESAADRFAMNLLSHLNEARTDSRASHTLAAGIALFFGVAEAVETSHVAFRNGTSPIVMSHMAPERRWESAWKQLSEVFPDVDPGFPRALLARIREMTMTCRAQWSSRFGS